MGGFRSTRKAPWPADEKALAQVRAFNRKLAWLPRFRIRNRLTPRLIQGLLRVSQVGGGAKQLRQHGLTAERRMIGGGSVAAIAGHVASVGMPNMDGEGDRSDDAGLRSSASDEDSGSACFVAHVHRRE